MWRAGAVVVALLVATVASAQQHDESAGNHRFPQSIQTGTSLVFFRSLGLGILQCDQGHGLGEWVYCQDCGGCGTPCANTAPPLPSLPTGAYAACIDGTWTCFSTADFCGTSVTTTTLSPCDFLAQVAACPFFCDTINGCPCPTTTTTAAPTTTTTTTLASTTTTTGAGTTTTTTTIASTTTTTINFASTGFMFGQDLPTLTVDRFNADGNTATVASGTSVILPAHGTGEQFSCRCNVTPFNQFRANHGGAFCGGGGGEPACPVWTLCLMQSNVPFSDAAYSDTALCCTVSPTISGCHDLASGHHVDIKDGGLLTVHGTANSDPPDHCACDVEVHP